MKVSASLLLVLAFPLFSLAHTPTAAPGLKGKTAFTEELRQHILEEYLQSAEGRKTPAKTPAPSPKKLRRPVTMASTAAGPSWLHTIMMASIAPLATAPAGNGALMAASFAPFKPKLRFYWDGTTFYEESDNMPDGMPNRMAGITSWQQQIPLPVAYFAGTGNPESATSSLGYGQPNYWRLPLVPTVAASPTLIFTPGSSTNNFQRGAIALASNGVAIFNPANNTGRVSYEIGELDIYGGHCGLADDYHYHIIPMHLSSRFGGPLSDDKPVAWALDGYPIYGYVEPDGSTRQALDSNGGHDHGGWGYHYHAVGVNTVDSTHPYGTPQSPYTMTSFRGTVVNFGGQVDGQPEVGSLRQDGSGGYNAKPVAGASIVAFLNPAPLVADGSGNLSLPAASIALTGCATTFQSPTITCASTTGLVAGMAIVGAGVTNNATVTSITSGTQFVMSLPAFATSTAQSFTAVPMAGASNDQFLMRVNMSGTNYDECWKINRSVNPRTLIVTWRAQALVSGNLSGPVVTTTNTYTPSTGTAGTGGTAASNRLAAYTVAGWSELKLPDTSQTQDTTATFGEDADYTINAQSFTDNTDGTITDNVTGLMWQKVDNGESTWDTAVTNAAGVSTGGYTDWRLPTPAELFSIFNHQNQNPALNTTYFPNNPVAAADYWWTSDIYGNSTTNVWCGNAGGGLGGKPKSETLSYSPPGPFRYHARYVRGSKPSNLHSYANNLDGTVTDTDTGLMWSQLPAAATSWDAALSYAENLSYNGYTDWRLPNLKELQTLTDYTLTTATSTTSIKPSINRTLFAKTLTNVTTTSGSTLVTCADTTGLLPGMPIVDATDLASSYISNSTVPTITSVTSATQLIMSSAATGSGSGLILRALAPPTAYWSSTSLRGDTTKAWLVETGINNSVLAANGPTRNSQGIISYEAKTSSYPVFVVRTTSVTTQIAVAQGANPLTDGVSTVSYSNVNVGSTLTKTFTINNTGVTTLTITGATIDGTNAANFAITAAPATSVAAGGSTTLDVRFNASTGGSKLAALHIASSDTAVGAAFDITLSGTGYVTPPTVTNVTVNPTVPSSTDTPYITAIVMPASGATLSSVQMTYSTGVQVTAPAFQEIFSNGSTTSGLAGTVNAWTATALRSGGTADVKQRGGTGNHTTPIVLTNCTTNGSTTVTCVSTTGLIPGMSLSGTNIATGATIASVTNATTLVLSTAATGSASSLSLTAAGISLTGCSLTTSPTIQCASTAGLVVGMGIAGTGLTTNPPNPTVLAITDGTHFTLNATVTAVPATLTASGTGLAFASGTAAYTDTMAATTNALSSSAPTAGYVEFYVRTADLFSNNGWTFQLSPDGGTTWNTRLAENFATASATNCTLNATTTVTCSNTSGLTVGNSLQGSAISIAACTTTSASTTVTTTDTGSLLVGMFIAGPTAAGIPANARITAISPGVSFTMSAAATASASAQTLTANYLPGNATISAINPNVSFTLNAAPFVSASGITLSSVNHGFALKHYDLVAGDLSASMKLRFQFSGYAGAVAPARPPEVDMDDITVVLTTGAAPATVTMYDDGLHGDGAAGDGVYGVQIPAQSSGTIVSYSISATDSASQTTTLASAGSYTTGIAPAITSSATLPNATPAFAYSTTLAATGGSGSNVWSIVSGSLPSGITLSSAGVISGTTSSQGTFNVSLKVTDSAGRIGTKAFTLTVTTTTAPNVVIILTDDQGWADVGYHTAPGQVPIQTPNMDRFGADGIRLEKFYPTTVCAVTRGCLLTGRNSLRTGVGNQKGLSPVEHLMPQTFKTAGYQTFMCGKWHIGGWDNNINTTTMNGATIDVQQEGFDYHPISRGWDFHKGQYGGAINYFTHTTADPGKNNALDWWQNNLPLPNDNIDLQGNGGYSTDLLADKAVELIQTRDVSKPLLLYLAFNAIHAGVSAPQSYLDKYAALGVAAPRRTVCAAIDCMDVAMGRVLTALDAAGITNNTLVIFMSDNGGETTSGSLNLPLRGNKSDPYDGGLHTPAGIRWPGHLTAGVTSNQYLWVGDVFPTVCAAVGVTPQNTKPFDGVNLWPALQSITPANPNGASRGAALVTGDAGAPVALNLFTDPINGGTKTFKLIRLTGTPVVNELFNLTDDSYETTDLLLGANASSYATIVTTLTSAITGIATESYPPNIGISGIPQTVVAGGSITLYAPFTSYKFTPTVQWKKGVSNVSSSQPFYQVTNSTGSSVAGVFMATLPLTNVSSADAGSYTATATNTTGSATTPAGTLTVVTVPVLNPVPAYSSGTSSTLTWPAVPSATDYTVQIATSSDFTIGLSSQTVTTSTATFTGLTSGTLYYYRATTNYNATSTPYSNVVSSTQDATSPVVAFTTSSGSTTHTSLQVQGTASDAASGLASVTLNGVTATLTSGTWSATLPLSLGSNTLIATATDNAGNTASASIALTRSASTQNDGLPDSWKTANNIPLTSAPANGPLGDLDGDGRLNLLEYAFNTNPRATDVNPFQSGAVTKAGDGLKYLEISYPRRIGALDLVYIVELSDDLTTWPSPGSATEQVSVMPKGDGTTETVTVRVLPAMTTVPKKFVRLRVTTQ